MELSKRLKAIADMVTPGNTAADVGCDHGFVSIYLCRHHIAPKVYAMDVRTGPLKRAKEHIQASGFCEYIETRLSDGVAALRPGEADTLICAGMGGRLMMKILSEGEGKIRLMKELILQPQSEHALFRRYLREHGLQIVQEDIIKEDGKFYPVIKAVPQNTAADTNPKTRKGLQEETRQRLEDSFGPLLLAAKNPVLREYLMVLEQRNKTILSKMDMSREGMEGTGQDTRQRTEKRRQEVEADLADIAECLMLYGK